MNPPLACDLATTCFVQNYFDRDQGPGAADFTCGPLSYDGHDGTDFSLPSLAMMRAGVDVIAAAPGTVTATRDGMADIAQDAPDAPDVTNIECGNGVVVSHGGGWETQYCHMKSGSIAVLKGARVVKGTKLGQVGLSGQTEFPHVHLSVRHDGTEIDPFHPDETLVCGEDPQSTLWQAPLPYAPGGLISAGFATEIPAYAAIKDGLTAPATLPDTAPALVLWAYAFGSRAGDTMALTIAGPGGEVLNEIQALDRTQARFFRAAGKRLTTANWPPGSYTGTAQLLRSGTVIDQYTSTLTLTP